MEKFKKFEGGIIMNDKAVVIAIILGALISTWTVSRTWRSKKKNPLSFTLDKICNNINDMAVASLDVLHRQGKKAEITNMTSNLPVFSIEDKKYKMSYSSGTFGQTVQTITFVPYVEGQ